MRFDNDPEYVHGINWEADQGNVQGASATAVEFEGCNAPSHVESEKGKG